MRNARTVVVVLQCCTKREFIFLERYLRRSTVLLEVNHPNFDEESQPNNLGSLVCSMGNGDNSRNAHSTVQSLDVQVYWIKEFTRLVRSLKGLELDGNRAMAMTGRSCSTIAFRS